MSWYKENQQRRKSGNWENMSVLVEALRKKLKLYLLQGHHCWPSLSSDPDMKIQHVCASEGYVKKLLPNYSVRYEGVCSAQKNIRLLLVKSKWKVKKHRSVFDEHEMCEMFSFHSSPLMSLLGLEISVNNHKYSQRLISDNSSEVRLDDRWKNVVSTLR